jgi:poly(3-hydroxybutyrate) depolymerase
MTVLFFPASAQKLKGEANKLHENKEYCKALETYEESLKSNEAFDNYSYYYAAQSACQCGQTEKAIDFYQRGFKIVMDWSAYEYFANDTLNDCFNQTSAWKQSLVEMKEKKDAYEIKLQKYLADLNDRSKRINESTLTGTGFAEGLTGKSFKNTVSLIRGFDQYPKPPLTGRWTVYYYKAGDDQEVPYLIYIPRNYDPKQKTPLYIHLHGAVRRTNFSINDIELAKHESPFLDQPISQGALIIYPFANKDFNWLLHQKAFEAVVGELRQVKSLYNVDDDRIYVTGHSNGGSGALWYALNMPTEFAAFSGFNYNPASYTGNTAFGNLKNNYTFLGVSGTEDSIFDFKTIDQIYRTVKDQGANWLNFGIKGNHGLPYDDPAAINFLYEALQKQRRDPFPKTLQWETDNAKNGRIFWLEIDELDTNLPKAVWQKPLEPLTADTVPNSAKSFFYNRSGAFKASISSNTVMIETSRIKKLTFYVVPELVDLAKPLKIYVNDQLLYNSKIKPDKNVLIEEFLKTKDRGFLVFNKIKLSIPPATVPPN